MVGLLDIGRSGALSRLCATGRGLGTLSITQGDGMSIVGIQTNAKDVARDLQASARELRLIMGGAMKEIGQRTRRDYERPTRTWQHKPHIIEEVETRGGKFEVMVGTDDEIFRFVDQGTRPHLIFPRKAKALRFVGGFRAKTTPGGLNSGQGGARGPLRFAAYVRHPGIKPRRFTETIQRRMNKFGPNIIDKHLKLWIKRQRRKR